MQLQHQQGSKGRESLPSNEDRGTATPHENERSRVSQLQPKPQSLVVVAASRELRMHRSSSYSYDEDVKRTHYQSRCSNSNIPDREAVSEFDIQALRRTNADAAAFYLEASGSSRHHGHGHFEQLPIGSRAQAEAKAKSSFTSHRDHGHREPSYYDTNSALPPLPFAFVKDASSYVRRFQSHPLKRQDIYSKGVDLNNLPPPPRQMSQSSQTSETDAFVSFQRLDLSNHGHGRSAEDAATSQLRKMCMDIVQSAED